MKFVVHASVLDADDNALGHVDRLVDRFADEVHRVEVLEPDKLQASRWYKTARATPRKLMTSAVARPPRAANDKRGPHAKTAEIFDAESARIADKLAHAPLTIMVEDREADGVFLEILVEELGWPELSSLWKAGKQVTPPALEFESASKGMIPTRVARRIVDSTEQKRPCRLFVLCDSDARWPGDTSSNVPEQVGVQEACSKHGVPLHFWSKRTAENYIPDQVFIDLRKERRFQILAKRLDALLRRSSRQRDHFPFKNGLKENERSEGLQVGLYESSEVEDLKLLEERLFDQRPRLLLRLAKDRRPSFTANGLVARDGNGELEALLLAIAREL